MTKASPIEDLRARAVRLTSRSLAHEGSRRKLRERFQMWEGVSGGREKFANTGGKRPWVNWGKKIAQRRFRAQAANEMRVRCDKKIGF